MGLIWKETFVPQSYAWGAGRQLCCPHRYGQNGNPGQLYLSFNNAKLKGEC